MTAGPESVPGCFGKYMQPLDLLCCLNCEAAEQCRKTPELREKAEPTEIPRELMEALKPVGTKRFIRVRPQDKGAFDDSWPDDLREPDDPVIQEWLQSGGNYGVVAGNGLIIVEIDSPEPSGKLPETFTVESGSGGTHGYYSGSTEENGVIHKLDRKPKDVDYNLGKRARYKLSERKKKDSSN